jgi:hypothetical protein
MFKAWLVMKTDTQYAAALKQLDDDHIENNWLAVTGASHSDRWGTLRTYFRSQLSPTGKIN